MNELFPEKSKVIVHDSFSWRAFANSRKSGLDLEGTYLPRTMAAHLKEETPFLEINKFHEYNGHGSFCERSKIGKRIVQYEQELAEMEKRILSVDELPGNYCFHLSPDHPHFEPYFLLRKEFDIFFRKHHNYYEGFAYWLEKRLAEEAGMELLYHQRKLLPLYSELVASFDKFVGDNSLDALLEKMGFE